MEAVIGNIDYFILPTYGVQYRQVCGRVRGYQFGSSYRFSATFGSSCTIAEPYVDGVSITHDMEPVQ